MPYGAGRNKPLDMIHFSSCYFINMLTLFHDVNSRLDYCNSLLAGLPTNAVNPLQMIQNAAGHIVFNQLKRT